VNVVVTIALLLANAFFVAVEFALITSRRTKLQPLAAADRRAKVALRATGALSFELAGAQLGVTMTSLGLGFVAEPMVSGWIEGGLRHVGGVPGGVVHTLGFVVALGLVSFFHMVVGEMVPKNIAIAAPERTLLWLALPDRMYVLVFGPIIRALNALANLGTRAFGVQPRDDLETVHTASEIALLLHASHDEGLLEDVEHELLAGALGFGEQPITQVMVPWHEVTTVGRDTTLAELEQVFVERGHSRVPVVAPNGRHVLGFLHAKDLLSMGPEARSRAVPLGRLRRMLIIQPDRTLADTLVTMQRAQLHMALVVHGGAPLGLATLEDVLEQLVGEIRDESDPALARSPRKPPAASDGGSDSRR
jgi:CBS domain containing-hemolysin-like protein